MEMKINFNKLFDYNEANSQTPSTTSLQNSYHLDEPSIISSPSNNINLHYKFSEAIFFDNSIIHENDDNNILNDLSSIGRSFDHSMEKYKEQKSPKKTKKTQFNRQEIQNQQLLNQHFNLSKEVHKAPGERLYYESKINKQRKQREIQRLKGELQQQSSKQVTFKPVLNQNSKKILELAQSPIRKVNNLKKSNKKKQEAKSIKSYIEQKQEQELKNCTFHPVINEKNPQNKFITTSGRSQQKGSNQKVFEQLYNSHKLKLMKKKQAEQQEEAMLKKGKKMTPQQLQQFFVKNQEYIQQKMHKEELMKAVSSQYDLTSGRKLFEPKVQQSMFNATSILFKNTSGQGQEINTPSPKVKSKQQCEDEIKYRSSKSINKGLRSGSKSGKSKEGKSKSKSRTINSKSSASLNSKSKISSNKTGQKLANSQKIDCSKNMGYKKLENFSSSHVPFAYQVSKLYQLPQQSQLLHQNERQEQIQVKKPAVSHFGYSNTSHSLFNKLKSPQQGFQLQNLGYQSKKQQQIILPFPLKYQQMENEINQKLEAYHNYHQEVSNSDGGSEEQIIASQQTSDAIKTGLIKLEHENDLQNHIYDPSLSQLQTEKVQSNQDNDDDHGQRIQKYSPSLEDAQESKITESQNKGALNDLNDQVDLETSPKPNLYSNPKLSAKYHNLFQIDTQQKLQQLPVNKESQKKKSIICYELNANQDSIEEQKQKTKDDAYDYIGTQAIKEEQIMQSPAKNTLYESIYFDQATDQKEDDQCLGKISSRVQTSQIATDQNTHIDDLQNNTKLQKAEVTAIQHASEHADINFSLPYKTFENSYSKNLINSESSVNSSPGLKKPSINIASLLKANKKKSRLVVHPDDISQK